MISPKILMEINKIKSHFENNIHEGFEEIQLLVEYSSDQLPKEVIDVLFDILKISLEDAYLKVPTHDWVGKWNVYFAGNSTYYDKWKQKFERKTYVFGDLLVLLEDIKDIKNYNYILRNITTSLKEDVLFYHENALKETIIALLNQLNK